MFNVHWIQHPVGHGGFHTGVAEIGGRELTWVYDCGSRSKQAFETYLSIWNGTRQNSIDWLFISHFDTDHVSGLQTLLHPARVRQVMLPYVNDEELVISLLHTIARDRLDRATTELMADPTQFLRDRGVERVVYVGPRGGGGSEVLPGVPDGPQHDGDWTVHMKPALPSKLDRGTDWQGSWPGDRTVMPDQAEYWQGGSEMVIEDDGLGMRFVPYRAAIEPGSAASLLHQLAALVGLPVSARPRIGLGPLALAAAKLAATEKGRVALVSLYKGHAKSSNRASMSLLTVPVVQPTFDFRWETHGGHRWDMGFEHPPAWLNTGDAELLDPADLADWQASYHPYLGETRVLSLPHHGSDYNSDASLYHLAPVAMLTAQVKHNAVKHPGPTTKLAAGERLVRVTRVPRTRVDMYFSLF